MTTPSDIDPLDPTERGFARVLRALPGGEPSPALDARILGAARDAVAQPQPRRRGLLWAGASSGAVWGISSAAAAILALGIAWRANAPVEEAAPRMVPTSSASQAKDADEDSTSVDFVEAPQAPAAMAEAAAPPPPPLAKVVAPAASRAQPDAHPVPTIYPEPAPEPVPAAPAPAAFPAEDVVANQERRERAAETESSRELDTITVTGSRISSPPAAPPAANTDYAHGTDRVDGLYARQQAAKARSDQRAAPTGGAADAPLADAAPAATSDRSELGALASGVVAPAPESPDVTRARVHDDAQLSPDAWLLRVRTRLREDDAAGARASLHLFVERHPQRAVPEDLRALLRQ